MTNQTAFLATGVAARLARRHCGRVAGYPGWSASFRCGLVILTIASVDAIAFAALSRSFSVSLLPTEPWRKSAATDMTCCTPPWIPAFCAFGFGISVHGLGCTIFCPTAAPWRRSWRPFRKALDVVDHVLNSQSAKLAAGVNQVNVIDGSNRCVRIDRRDFDAMNIVLLHNHVAEASRENQRFHRPRALGALVAGCRYRGMW